jgi:hypothetical protein
LAGNLSLALWTEFSSAILTANFSAQPSQRYRVGIFPQRFSDGFLYDSQAF